VRTTQVIAPGYACVSNRFLSRALDLVREDLLYVTSANRSRHLTGAPDEPAHWRADGLRTEFGSDPDFVVLAHPDEDAARRRYPLHAPMSTTILAFHKVANTGREVRLVVERHGSLPIEQLRPVVERLGFGLDIAPTGGPASGAAGVPGCRHRRAHVVTRHDGSRLRIGLVVPSSNTTDGDRAARAVSPTRTTSTTAVQLPLLADADDRR
jgi:hypothetical protein